MNNPIALIIEDDPSSGNLFSHILEFVGYTTEIIKDGKTALARLDEIVPTLVLLDLNLPPGVSGSDVLYSIRANQKLADIPVLVVTAYPNIAEEIHNEADLVLFKPVSVGQLRNLVSRFYPQEISRQLMEDATIDPVTGLPNRASFLEQLTRAVDRIRRFPIYKFAVLKVDFSETEYLERKQSRQNKENLLYEITQKLRPLLRRTDTIARTSRYEFSILLDDITDTEDAVVVAKKLKISFLLPVQLDEEKIDVVGDFSYSSSKDIYENPEEYLLNVMPIKLEEV
jgi:diguanylate cyclase (GGDEF)-like protein